MATGRRKDELTTVTLESCHRSKVEKTFHSIGFAARTRLWMKTKPYARPCCNTRHTSPLHRGLCDSKGIVKRISRLRDMTKIQWLKRHVAAALRTHRRRTASPALCTGLSTPHPQRRPPRYPQPRMCALNFSSRRSLPAQVSRTRNRNGASCRKVYRNERSSKPILCLRHVGLWCMVTVNESILRPYLAKYLAGCRKQSVAKLIRPDALRGASATEPMG